MFNQIWQIFSAYRYLLHIISYIMISSDYCSAIIRIQWLMNLRIYNHENHFRHWRRWPLHEWYFQLRYFWFHRLLWHLWNGGFLVLPFFNDFRACICLQKIDFQFGWCLPTCLLVFVLASDCCHSWHLLMSCAWFLFQS